jgi:hypothetical protein
MSSSKKKGLIMQTIQLQVQDSIYNQLINSGVDIQAKVNEFLIDILDDGYPSISTDEAKRRVSDAIERYKNDTGVYTPYDKNFADEMSQYIQSL